MMTALKQMIDADGLTASLPAGAPSLPLPGFLANTQPCLVLASIVCSSGHGGLVKRRPQYL